MAAGSRERAVAQSSGVRILTSADLTTVVQLMLTNPVENAFVASRIRQGGLDQFTLGCPVWGFENDGR
ncbi:MAG: hypothetical protein ACR2I1_07405, partial [Propionibacteriaceae bacterium]